MTRLNKILVACIIVIGVAGVCLYVNSNVKAKAGTPSLSNSQPCTNAKPCIELADNNGKPLGIKFNDFRFGPQGCIYYRMNVGDKFKEWCGGYNMLWIGPGLPPGHESKV